MNRGFAAENPPWKPSPIFQQSAKPPLLRYSDCSFWAETTDKLGGSALTREGELPYEFDYIEYIAYLFTTPC